MALTHPVESNNRRALRLGLGAAYAVAAGLTGLSVWLAASPVRAPIAEVSRLVLWLLGFNLLLLFALAAVVGWQVFSLYAARGADAGARLHLRFVGLFALAAVAPAVVVALAFGVLVTQGVESWFGSQVRTVVENSATVARTYINDQVDFLSPDLQLAGEDLDRAAPLLAASPVTYGRLLAAQAEQRNLAALYVVDGTGAVLAQAEQPGAPPFLAPPRAALTRADDGSVAARADDPIRVAYRLRAYPDAYLYAVQRLDGGVLTRLRQAEQSVLAYRDAERSRERIQAVFALSYAETALLVLVGAVWLGMAAASRIAGPVARLTAAADRAAGGDLSARVDVDGDPEELAVLTRAFNRMTHDLDAQQRALRAASAEAEERRGFIEAVLGGVSAGVIGLDGEGRVSALNRRARQLLEVGEADVFAQPLAEVAPELLDVAADAAARGVDAEAELDVVRGAETRRLRVRASAAEGGQVLTFDDVTRLLAAQRAAAWRDVARRIAHEIKNPLTPIQLSAERLRRRYRKELTGDVEVFDRCTDTIIRQVGDIGRMVDEFSSFARMPAPRMAETDAAELLRAAVFAQRVRDERTRVELEAPGAVTLMCDERMVGQSLANLLKNAGEAVAARRDEEPDLAGRILARLVVDDAGVGFWIEDNGVGLPAKDRETLTEPYVTTREKGTGLGLAIVKRVMEDHGGTLRLLDASSGRGACAVLQFPPALARPAESPRRELELVE